MQGFYITSNELTAFFPVVRVVFVLVEFVLKGSAHFVNFMTGAFFHPHHVFFNEDDFSDESVGHLDVELDVRVTIGIVGLVAIFYAGDRHARFPDF